MQVLPATLEPMILFAYRASVRRVVTLRGLPSLLSIPLELPLAGQVTLYERDQNYTQVCIRIAVVGNLQIWFVHYDRGRYYLRL